MSSHFFLPVFKTPVKRLLGVRIIVSEWGVVNAVVESGIDTDEGAHSLLVIFSFSYRTIKV